jgi:hypothetical protein
VTKRLAAVNPHDKMSDLVYLITTDDDDSIDSSDFSTKNPLQVAEQAKEYLVACLGGLAACAADDDDSSYNFDAHFDSM